MLAIPKLGAHYIEVQIQTPEANSQCSFIEKYAFCLFTGYMVEIIF